MNERTTRWLSRGLLTLGAGLLAVWLGTTLESCAVQDRLARRLAALAHAPRSAHATRHEARLTGLIGRIEVPRLKLSAMVLEGTERRALRRGVGHVASSPLPGEDGNVVLAGHRDTYFRGLRDIETGDLIRITTPDGAYAYQVDSILVVKPDRSDLIADTPGPELTLVTCYPFYWVGPAPKRFVIRARPAEAVHAAKVE
jgi:sortase A